MKAVFAKRMEGIFPTDETGRLLVQSMKQGDKCEVKYNDKRPLSMNGLSHVWYGDIAKETSQLEHDVKSECKLIFGVPILRSEDDDFRDFYDGAIKGALTYEEKLKAMRYVPVTSIMDKSQMHRYLNAMQTKYAEQGIILQSLGEYADVLAKEAEALA